MRSLFVFAYIVLLTSCVTRGPVASVPASSAPADRAEEQGAATYYDRNHDGAVDLELHQFGCCDRDWALVDTHFNGRYDLKIHWGYGLTKSKVDLAVPKSAHITSGDPPVSVAW